MLKEKIVHDGPHQVEIIVLWTRRAGATLVWVAQRSTKDPYSTRIENENQHFSFRAASASVFDIPIRVPWIGGEPIYCRHRTHEGDGGIIGYFL